MTPNQIGALVDGAIPFLGGIYCTLLGFRVIGKKPGEDARYDERMEKHGGVLKIFGPIVAAFGIILATRGLSGN